MDRTTGAAGLVTVNTPIGPVPSLGPGPAVLAFDVGGTDTKAALFDEAGTMLGLSRSATGSSPGKVLGQIETLTYGFARDYPWVNPSAIAMVGPGIVDDDQGVAVLAANLGWHNVAFKELLQSRFDVQASFSHDVRAAGTAELRLGAARPYLDVLVVVAGTGIAAALFVDGHAHLGAGFAGEIGHSVLDPLGETCVCGARGCLETIASAGAISRRYQQATGIRPGGAKGVLQRVRLGDAVATRIWNDAISALALHLAQVIALISPEAIVVGGGLAQAGDALFTPLREQVDGLLSFHRRPALVPALLGENAGLLGAGLRARGTATKVQL